ncbi:poly(R)-hydroxyalkanoic acid synthase subunit PhaE [Halorhodospira halochloris]|uniref:poly(R)-hydroxyalkanoic acid synthase subunit PhaE n=1 Tax=Halorhodospira halochloris TaxID=1052 RepID=UPI001EE8F098|nr:poly(R)-hydroxyalkanoic acid synthase subunit PhaE [Halorhodospira halochloris]MCG5548349.1 hypothetical protein [Halorhodospira halochloris]
MNSPSSHSNEKADWAAALEALAELWQALSLPVEQREAAISRACEQLQEHVDQSLSALLSAGHTAPDQISALLDGTSLTSWLETLTRLGPLQCPQQDSLALSQAVERYTRAQARCTELLQASTYQGMQNFYTRLSKACSTGSDEMPKSLRELYELWLNESERAYEQALSSEQWCAAFTELTHAGTELIAQYQQILDSGLRSIDLPNRTDFIDTQRRVYELEKIHQRPPPTEQGFPDSQTARCSQHPDSYSGLCPAASHLSGELEQLRQEVVELRAEVAQLRETGANQKTTQ